MTQIMLNRAHHPVTTLGPGIRAGLWVQGCTIGCRGCASQDTWIPDDELLVDVDEVVRWLTGLEPLDGVTVTGGEPFQQVDGLTALLHAIRRWAAATGRVLDVLVYSGYTYSALRRRSGAQSALDLCDAVVTGPYVDRLNPGGRWRGSANQQLVVLTELGRERSRPEAEPPTPEPAARLQLADDGERTWLVGIPGRGDLARLEASLIERGIKLEGASWHG